LLYQFFDYPKHKHGLALARITLNPKQLALIIATPSLKFSITQDPSEGVIKQTALCALNASSLGFRVRNQQPSEAGLVFVCEVWSN
jgi:hypothetical protein